jgi:signal transduction histidine kinase
VRRLRSVAAARCPRTDRCSARRHARQAERRADAEQDRRRSDTRAARADERTAIARELHDVVAHHVASIVLRVGVARHVLVDTDPRITKVLDDVHATGGAALADLRRLVTVLRDPQALPNGPAVVSVEPGSLPAALTAAVEQAELTGITVVSTIDPRLSIVDAVRALAVLRLTQEGLTNVARHAGPAAQARLDVVMDNDALRWELTDDGGTGPTTIVEGTGHGIIGMRERVEVLGGELTAGPAGDGPGWTLRTVLPERIEQTA